MCVVMEWKRLQGDVVNAIDSFKLLNTMKKSNGFKLLYTMKKLLDTQEDVKNSRILWIISNYIEMTH
jgi:hypothetical protein